MEIKKAIIWLLLVSACFGASDTEHGGDVILTGDGAKIVWHNNGQTVSIAAPPGMLESVAYFWMIEDGDPGQAIVTDGFGVLDWADASTAFSHNLLSPTHTDTTTDGPTRGSLVYGNATPKWDELVIGAANKFLQAGASDVSWAFIDISDSTNLAVTSPITLTGDSIGIVNQGSTTTVLHGNAGGNASFGTVDISDDTNLAVDTDHFKLTDDTLSFSDNEKVLSHSRQGSFLEQIDFTVSEAGGTVTGSLEKEGGGDLTQFWSDDFDALDCTGPVCTVDLTARVGTDTSPAAAFVYILQSAKTTLVAATSWPAASVEHIRIATLILQSAATTGTEGVLGNRNWNDMVFGISNPRGHTLHIGERMRFEHALHQSGVVLSVTGSGTGTVTIATTAGSVYQLHLQTFPSIDMAGADNIHLVNLSGSEYSTSVNFVADITTLANGSTALGNNKFFNLVIWGVQNRTGETSHLLCNLPIGQYGKQGDATVDAAKFSVHTIPDDFRGTGFLIAELTFQKTGGGSPVWTLIQNKDLLGQTPILVPGGGTTNNITTFVDSAFEVFDNGDDTKRIDFELSSITTGNTRTITWADNDINFETGLDIQNGGTGAANLNAFVLVDGSNALAGAWDMGSQALTNVNIDSGTLDTTNVTIGQGTAIGAITANGNIKSVTTTIAAQLTADASGTTASPKQARFQIIAEAVSGSAVFQYRTSAGNKFVWFYDAAGNDLELRFPTSPIVNFDGGTGAVTWSTANTFNGTATFDALADFQAVTINSTTQLKGNITVEGLTTYIDNVNAQFGTVGDVSMKYISASADFEILDTVGTAVDFILKDFNTVQMGDGTNKVTVDNGGNMTFEGAAGFYPRLVRQDAEPANGAGPTGIDNEELMLWIDTNDGNKVYLMLNDNTNTNIAKWEADLAGGGDVTAASNLGDNLLIRGDGATKGVQNSGITIDDTDNISGVTSINFGDENLAVYDEGTWTPILGGSGGTSGQSYSSRVGNYTKIGRLVTCNFRFVLTTKGTITGTLFISGLPFSPKASEHSPASLGWQNKWTLTAGHLLEAYVSGSGTTISIREVEFTGDNEASLDTNAVENGTSLMGSVTYMTD